MYAEEYPEMSPAEIAYYTAECALEFPNAEILAPASTTYNCHSYAWNITEGGPICWLNQYPDLHLYWDDNSYEQTIEANAKKIFYYAGDHSAVKSTTHSGKYESKWGSYPLVRHSPEYGPSIYNMQYRKYYKCSTTNFINQMVTTNTTVIGCGINVQNVTVTNNAKLTLDSSGETVINGPFEVVLGSQLEVK
ncbi:hypothetical protein FACS1894160_1810 [Bacteroidia bacterium]|nr:hypothetical protein FACS1894160_1810 [Bacteroidia bacterium]